MKKKKTTKSLFAGFLLLFTLSFGAGLNVSAEPYQENDGSGGKPKPPACTSHGWCPTT